MTQSSSEVTPEHSYQHRSLLMASDPDANDQYDMALQVYESQFTTPYANRPHSLQIMAMDSVSAYEGAPSLPMQNGPFTSMEMPHAPRQHIPQQLNNPHTQWHIKNQQQQCIQMMLRHYAPAPFYQPTEYRPSSFSMHQLPDRQPNPNFQNNLPIYTYNPLDDIS